MEIEDFSYWLQQHTVSRKYNNEKKMDDKRYFVSRNDVVELFNTINRPPNNTVEHDQAKKCSVFKRCRYRELPDCNDQCRHKPPVG